MRKSGKPTAVAYFGSAEEKERFLHELRAEMASQALDHGGWACPYALVLTGHGVSVRGLVPLPLWMPQAFHREFHNLFHTPAGVELAFFEAIEPGADLTGAMGTWKRHQGDLKTFYQLTPVKRQAVRQAFWECLKAVPVRKVP